MQLSSPQLSCGVLDIGGDGNGFSWRLIEDLDIPDLAHGGLCGACQVEGDVVLATQSTPPYLVLYDPVAGRIKAKRDVSPCSDLHSVVYHQGALYVASTGTNEVYRITLGDDGFGEPRVFWRYPGVEYDRDLVHLNGLTGCDQGLIACCFGPQQSDGSWGNNGAVFQVEPFEVIRDGLSEPHSPLCAGGRLFFAESKRHRVHVLNRDKDGAWHEKPSIDVGGYARGLASQDGRLWVGLSASRAISRSKATLNQKINSVVGAAIACIDLVSHTVTDRRKLSGLGEEIYDLLILDEVGPIGRLLDALTERIMSMQTALNTLRVESAAAKMLGVENNEAVKRGRMAILQENLARERVHGNAAIEELLEQRLRTEKLEQSLHSERACVDKLVQQLRTVEGSRLWRFAQLLRRFAGSPLQVFDLDRPKTLVEAPAERSMSVIFHEIYAHNVWGSEVSRSGTGSDLQQTAVIREALPKILKEFSAQTMLDIPCGDYHWMKMIELDVDYIGADVVTDIIAANSALYSDDRRRFQTVDIANDDLPRVDVVFCRDLLVHFSYADALRAIANLKRSGSTYLLTTTFTNRTSNVNIETGQWRALNLELPPFDFPRPVRLINENCTEWGTDWADKSLGLWRLADLLGAVDDPDRSPFARGS